MLQLRTSVVDLGTVVVLKVVWIVVVDTGIVVTLYVINDVAMAERTWPLKLKV